MKLFLEKKKGDPSGSVLHVWLFCSFLPLGFYLSTYADVVESSGVYICDQNITEG